MGAEARIFGIGCGMFISYLRGVDNRSTRMWIYAKAIRHTLSPKFIYKMERSESHMRLEDTRSLMTTIVAQLTAVIQMSVYADWSFLTRLGRADLI